MAYFIYHHASIDIPQEEILSSEIYTTNGKGLGDCWASVSFILRMSEQQNKALKVSTWYNSDSGIPRDVRNKLEEIIPLMNSSGKIILTEEKNTIQLTEEQVYHGQYLPTHIQWQDNVRKYFGYQFDGKSHRKFTNMSTKEENKILTFIEKNGYKPRKLGGGNVNIRENVRIASECRYFVGVDSGLSHVCYSVGTPVSLIINGRNIDHVNIIHGTKKKDVYKNADDFINNFKFYLPENKCIERYCPNRIQ